MPKFDDLLMATLKGVNQSHEAAVHALRQTVGALAQAVARVAGGRPIELALYTREESTEGTVYSLSLQYGKERLHIEDIRVPVAGYPIAVGQYVGTFQEFTGRIWLQENADIEMHFEEMLRNPSSPLIVKLAYLVRKEEVAD